MRTQVRIGNVNLDALTHDEVVHAVMDGLALGRGGLLITPNVDILRMLRRPANAVISERATLAVCDGVPLLWASQLAGTPLPARVTGAGLIRSLSRAAARAGRSVYVLGGPVGVAEEASRRLQGESRGLEVKGWSCPPHGFDQDPPALDAVVAEVAAAGPDIVFVCLGFPKQEHLALRLAERMPQSWFVGCGAAVEFVAGSRHRAPPWMQRSGLEWLHRMAQEPTRLGPRYAKDAFFLVHLLADALRSRVRQERVIDLTEAAQRAATASR